MTCRAGLRVCKENGVRSFEPSPDNCGLPIAQNCETQSRGLTVRDVVFSPSRVAFKNEIISELDDDFLLVDLADWPVKQMRWKPAVAGAS